MRTRLLTEIRLCALVLGAYAPLAGCPAREPPLFDPPDEGPDVLFTSDNPSFGLALAAGDFGGDASLDVAISEFGATRVFLGPLESDRTADEASAVLAGEGVAAGDLDGDGRAELMASSLANASDTVVHVYGAPLGSPPADRGDRANITLLHGNLAAPPIAVADLQDSAGQELVVGMPGYEGRDPDEGAKLLLFEASAVTGQLTSEDAAVLVQAGISAKWFYYIDVDDVTGDGRADLLFSFSGFNHASSSYLVEAPLVDAREDSALEDMSSVIFGWTQARLLGDLDGDGLPDIGLPAYDSLQIWTGTLAGPDPGEPDATIDSLERPQSLSLQPAGDLDGDGTADLLVADPPVVRTYVFFGPLQGTIEPDIILERPEQGVQGFDQSLVLPDLDDNGTTELLLGAAGENGGGPVGLVWLKGLPWPDFPR